MHGLWPTAVGGRRRTARQHLAERWARLCLADGRGIECSRSKLRDDRCCDIPIACLFSCSFWCSWLFWQPV